MRLMQQLTVILITKLFMNGQMILTKQLVKHILEIFAIMTSQKRILLFVKMFTFSILITFLKLMHLPLAFLVMIFLSLENKKDLMENLAHFIHME